MNRCFAGNDTDIVSSSDYIIARKRKNIFSTMQKSVGGFGNPNARDRASYLAHNRNYRLKTRSQLPHKAKDNANCLAYSHSYADYLNMVKGKHYANPKLLVPPGVGNWLPSFLQRVVTKPQMAQKIAVGRMDGASGKIWGLPYAFNVLERPPNGEDFSTYVHSGYPPNLLDPYYEYYKGNCQNPDASLKFAKIAALGLYGVPAANANDYRYYQLAMTQPTSGMMYPSKVSFDYVEQEQWGSGGKNGGCCNGCGEGAGTWMANAPQPPANCYNSNREWQDKQSAPGSLPFVKDQKPCQQLGSCGGGEGLPPSNDDPPVPDKGTDLGEQVTEGVKPISLNDDGNVDLIALDTTGDGNIDLGVARILEEGTEGTGVSVFDQDGDGVADTLAVDTNNDGTPDLVVVLEEPSGTAAPEIDLTGDGVANVSLEISGGVAMPEPGVLIDVDGDGEPEVVVAAFDEGPPAE